MANLDALVEVLNGYFRQHASEFWLESSTNQVSLRALFYQLEKCLGTLRPWPDMVVQTEHDRVGPGKGSE